MPEFKDLRTGMHRYCTAHPEDSCDTCVTIGALIARVESAEAALAEMREEWTVRHSQGIHPGPFTEQAARDWIAESVKADARRQAYARGRQRLLRRYVTRWTEVALTTPADQGDNTAGGGSDG